MTSTTPPGSWPPAVPARNITLDVMPGTLCTVGGEPFALLKSCKKGGKEEPVLVRMYRTTKVSQKTADASKANRFRDSQYDPETLTPHCILSKDQFTDICTSTRTSSLSPTSSSSSVASLGLVSSSTPSSLGSVGASITSEEGGASSSSPLSSAPSSIGSANAVIEPPLSVAVPPNEEVAIVGSVKIKVDEYVIPVLSVAAHIKNDEFLKDLLTSFSGRVLRVGRVVRINSLGIVLTANFSDHNDSKDWFFLPNAWCQGISVISTPHPPLPSSSSSASATAAENAAFLEWENRTFNDALKLWKQRLGITVRSLITVRMMECLSFRVNGLWWRANDPLNEFNRIVQFFGEAEGSSDLSEIFPLPSPSSSPSDSSLATSEAVMFKQEPDFSLSSSSSDQTLPSSNSLTMKDDPDQENEDETMEGKKRQREQQQEAEEERERSNIMTVGLNPSLLVSVLKGRNEFRDYVVRQTFEDGAVLEYKASSSDDCRGLVFVPYDTLLHFDNLYPESSPLPFLPESFAPRKSSSRAEDLKPKPSPSHSLMYS